ANALLAVKITTIPTAASGTLTDNGVAVAAGSSVRIAGVHVCTLVFTRAANTNGAGEDSFTFQVQDNDGTANGGVDLDPSANTITVNVASSNDALSRADKTVTPYLDTGYQFTAVHSFPTRRSSDLANALLAVKITTIPTAASGTLTDNGVAVAAGSSV